ncbi:unnamed protein product [Timema podura]|uniref:Uncharacterized protein n=1 Tax=Timema podura TaxID=61482 RepID=A0ABN7NKK0_TIMPD|nr:unnamed protein product [Timema podura]
MEEDTEMDAPFDCDDFEVLDEVGGDDELMNDSCSIICDDEHESLVEDLQLDDVLVFEPAESTFVETIDNALGSDTEKDGKIPAAPKESSASLKETHIPASADSKKETPAAPSASLKKETPAAPSAALKKETPAAPSAALKKETPDLLIADLKKETPVPQSAVIKKETPALLSGDIKKEAPGSPSVGSKKETPVPTSSGVKKETPAAPSAGLKKEMPVAPSAGLKKETPASPSASLKKETPALLSADIKKEAPGSPSVGSKKETPVPTSSGSKKETLTQASEGSSSGHAGNALKASETDKKIPSYSPKEVFVVARGSGELSPLKKGNLDSSKVSSASPIGKKVSPIKEKTTNKDIKMEKANETIAKDAGLLKRKRETIEDKKIPAKKQKEVAGKSVETVKVASVTSPEKTAKALTVKKVGQTSGDKKDVPGKNQPRSPGFNNKTDLEKREYFTSCIKKLTVTLKDSYYQYRRWSEKNRKDGFICPVVDSFLSGQEILYHRCMLYAGVDKDTHKLLLGIRRQMFVVLPNLINFAPPVAKTIKVLIYFMYLLNQLVVLAYTTPEWSCQQTQPLSGHVSIHNNWACQDLVQMVGKPVFDETKGKGFWRSILIRCNNAGDVLLQVDLHAASRKAADAVFKEMKSVLIEFFSTGGGKDCNVKSLYLKIVLKDLQCIKGTRYIEETVGGMKVKLYPHSYFNTGTTAMKALGEVLAAVAKREGTTEVLEVGCGTGIIGQMLSKHSKEVYGIDTESAVEDALENADMNGIKNCYYFGGNTVVGLSEVSKLLSASSNALAIVNSTGADVLSGAKVLKEVCQMAGIKTLAYVSVFSKRCWVNMLELLKPQDSKPTFSFLPYYMIPIDFGLHCYSAIVVMKHIEKNFVSELYDLPNSISLKDSYKKESGVKKTSTLNVNKAIKMGDKTKVRASMTKLGEANKERFSITQKPLWTAKTALSKAKNTVNTKLLSRQRIEFGEARRNERGMLADSRRDIRVWEREREGDFRKPATDRGQRSQYTGHGLSHSRGSTDHRSRSRERAGGMYRGQGQYPRGRPHSRDRGKISSERDINRHTAPARKDWNDEVYMNVVYRNNESIIEQDPKRNVWVREDGLITAVVEGADGKITDTKLGYNDGLQDLRSLLHKAPNIEAQYSPEVDSWGNVINHEDGDLRTFLQVKRTSHQHPQASDTALFVGDMEDSRMFVRNNDEEQPLHSGQFGAQFGKEFPPARHDAVQENMDLREVLQDKRTQHYDSPTFDRTNRMDFHYPHATETKSPVKLIDKPSQDLRTILDRGQHQISEVSSKEKESVFNAQKTSLATDAKINSKKRRRGTRAGRGRQKRSELWSPSNTRMGDDCSNYDQPSSVVAGDQNIKVQPEDNSFRQSVSRPHDIQDKGMSSYPTSPHDNRMNIYSPNVGNIGGTAIERNSDNRVFQRHSAHMFDSASQPVDNVHTNLDARDTRINYRDSDNRSNSRDISFHGGGNASRDRKSAPDLATRENIRNKGEDIDNFRRGCGSLDRARDRENLKSIDTRDVRTNPRDLDLHISKPNIPGADTLDNRASRVDAVERYDRPGFRDSDMKGPRGNRNIDATRNLFGQNVDSRDNKFKEALSVPSWKSQNRTNVHNFDHGSNRSRGLEVAETREHNKNRDFGNSQSVSTREGRGHNTSHNVGTIHQDNPAWYTGPLENQPILTKHDIHNNRPYNQTVGISDRASHGNMEAQRYNPPAHNTDSLQFDPPARNTDSLRFDPPARNTDSLRY